MREIIEEYGGAIKGFIAVILVILIVYNIVTGSDSPIIEYIKIYANSIAG